jgi:ubiquinone/menaquinone biosynthesis C-methylase UbiE
MTAAYDDVATAYSKVFDNDEHDDPVLVELIGDVAGREVLALGCGQGRDARMVARHGGAVVGVDVSKEMLRFAREHEATRRGIRYLEGDARHLAELNDASFDGVVSHLALVDMPELSPAIREVARVLRAGGWFVFSIVHPCYPPHVENVAEYLDEHRYDKLRPPDWLPRHAFHRPVSAYVNELDAAGLSLRRMHEVHHPSGPGTGVPGLLYARAEKR